MPNGRIVVDQCTRAPLGALCVIGQPARDLIDEFRRHPAKHWRNEIYNSLCQMVLIDVMS